MGKYRAKTVQANESVSGAPITNFALTSGVAVYTEGILVERNVGFMTLLITEDIAGGAGDVDVSAEYSVDNVNWYTPYDSDLAGVIAAEGNIVTALQNEARWIVFAPRLARYIRFKLDPDADSRVSAKLIYQDDH